MKKRAHCLGEKFHNWKVVHIGEYFKVVYIVLVVLWSIDVGMVVALGMVHMIIGMVNIGSDHMEVNGGMGLVSKVVEGYVEEGIHMHMVCLTTTRRSTTSIRLVCIRSWIVPIRNRRRLLPRRLFIGLRLLPPLISKYLMQTLIEVPISISLNIV